MRLSAYFLSILTIVNPLAPAFADILTDQIIENDFDTNPVYLDSSSSSYSYESPQYMEWTSSSAKNLEWMYKQALSEVPDTISEPTYVPIAVGDITTIIPTYKRYKNIGTAAVQARYIRTQVKALLGRSLLLEHKTELAQQNQLFTDSFEYLKNNPHLKFGDRLDFDQINSGITINGAAKNIVWPELRTVNGQQVIVPVLYLTAETVAEQKIEEHTINIDGYVELDELNARNVDIRAAHGTFIATAGALTSYNSDLTSDGSLSIVAGGRLDNISSIIRARGDLNIEAKSITNQTIVYRYDLGFEQGSGYGAISEISSTDGSVTLSTITEDPEEDSQGRDITNIGAIISAEEGSVKLNAAGNITIAGTPIYNREGSSRNNRSTLSYLQSQITAEDAIELAAGQGILIDASEIVSDSGHISLLASKGIVVQDRLVNSTSYYKRGNKTEETYKSVAMRSLLDAGETISIRSEFGDITLQAADISSSEGTTVSAANGSLNLLLTKETDHYSYSNVKENMFTTTTINRGHTYENAAYNRIVGGFSVAAVANLNVQIETEPGLTLAQQVDNFRHIEGMEWLVDIYDQNLSNPDINWEEVELIYKEWNEKNTSLNAASMAMIAVVMAVVTGGAGAALFAGQISSAVAQAAITSMATMATQSAANAAVNGGNFLEVFEAGYESVLSEEGAKQVATSMVTAWAIAQVNAEFFQNIDPEKVDPSWLHNAEGQLSLAGQATQQVVHAAVSTSTSTLINGGELSDFGDSFTKSLLSSGVNAIGKQMATEIGELYKAGDIINAVRYIAHAGSGCLIGVAKASVDGGESGQSCAVGAGGAVVGEVVADVRKSYTQVGQDAAKLEEFLIRHGLDDPQNLTYAQQEELINLDITATAAELSEFGLNTAQYAKLSGALAAFVAGAEASEINIAAFSAENAAANNALFLIPVAIMLLKALDVAATGYELYEIYEIYNEDPEEGRKRLVAYFGEQAASKIIEKAIPGASTFRVFVTKLGDAGVISPKLAKQINVETKNANDVDFDNAVTPSASGNVGCKAGGAAACTLDLDGAQELDLKADITTTRADIIKLKANPPVDAKELQALNVKVGEQTEKLTKAVAHRSGWKSLEGGKFGSDNGIDHTFTYKDADGSVHVVLIDSKQVNKDSFKLGNTKNGVQLDKRWIDEKLTKMDPSSEAFQAIVTARAEGNLKKGVAGLDKSSGEFKIIPIDKNW